MKRLAMLTGVLICLAISLVGVRAGPVHTQQLSVTKTPLEFDAATIKPTPDGPTRIEPDGRRVTVHRAECRGTDREILINPLEAPPALGTCIVQGEPLKFVIRTAYSLARGAAVGELVTGGPDWAGSESFDILAKAEDPGNTTQAQLLLMLQKLLADRFKLQIHTEAKEVQGFALMVAKDGPKLKPGKGDPSDIRSSLLEISATNASMSRLATVLSGQVRSPVDDQTGLKDRYEFTLSLEGASIFTILQEELGLRLVAQKVKVDTIVIDHVEKPAEN